MAGSVLRASDVRFRGRRGAFSAQRSVRGARLLAWQVQYFGLLMFDFVAIAALSTGQHGAVGEGRRAAFVAGSVLRASDFVAGAAL